MTESVRRVVVFGGRFTATKKQFFDAMDYCFKDPDVMATDVLMTELSPSRFRKIVRTYARSRKIHVWHPRRAGANECAIFSVDRLRRRGYLQLTNLRIKVGRTDPINLIEAKVYHGPWWSIWHTAAHNFGLRPGVFATTIYYSTLGPYRNRLRERSRAKHGAGSGGDFNVGIERVDMQKTILKNVPGWHFTENVGGKHEIIGMATNMKIVEPARELKRLAGYDHRPVLSVLEQL